MTRPTAFGIAVSSLLAACFLMRFFGVTEVGVGGNDSIYYFSLAEHWLNGNFVFQIADSVSVFRPVYLGYNAAAFFLFGHQDYALKLANVVTDCFNVALVAYLAWQLSRRRSVVMSTALSYALLPMAIWASRVELPHTCSTFFIIVAVIVLLHSLASDNARGRLILGACSGASIGAAALTHEELILFIGGSTLLLLWDSRWLRKDSLSAACLRCAAHAAPVIVCGLVITAFQWQVVSGVLGIGTAPAQSNLAEKGARYLWQGLSGSTSSVFVVLYVAVLATFTLASFKSLRLQDGRREVAAVLFCLWSPLLYVVVYSLFFNTVFARALLPLVPLMLAGFFAALSRLAGNWRIIRVVAVSTGAIVIALSNFASYSDFKVANRKFGQNWSMPEWPSRAAFRQAYFGLREAANYSNQTYYTHWKHIHEQLEGRVNAENRLLILPSRVIYAPGRRPLQTDVYFGDNAIYRVDHAEESLAELVAAKDIRYVLFTQAQLRGEPSTLVPYRYNGFWGARREINLSEAYGMAAYNIHAEANQLSALLRTIGATFVPFAEGTFEVRWAYLWELPR